MNRTALSAQQLSNIQGTLKGYFDKIVQAHDQLRLPGKTVYGTSNVQWLQQAPSSVAPHELLIYLLPSGTTLVTNGKLEQGKPLASHDGFTNFLIQSRTSSGKTAASEVFPNFPTTNAGLKLVANLMFHEAMHNKLGYNDPQLHNRGGLASGSSQAAPITDATQLTASNISLLAATWMILARNGLRESAYSRPQRMCPTAIRPRACSRSANLFRRNRSPIFLANSPPTVHSEFASRVPGAKKTRAAGAQ